MWFRPRRAAPFKYAGRWLEHFSNEMPRGMIADPRKGVYRIRPIDLSCTFQIDDSMYAGVIPIVSVDIQHLLDRPIT